MNDYQISKLKKQLQRKQDLLKEEREERKNSDMKLGKMQAERDRFYGELEIARQTIENVDQIIAQNVKQMRVKLQQENSESLSELQKLKDHLLEEKMLNERLLQQNKHKETVISELSLRLRELSRKYKDPSLLVNTKEITEQAIITHNQFYKLTEKYNKLCTDMDNIMAENKILRKLSQVPDTFGFDLEEIKIAEKQELEDYKAQCRRLETEIEELEATEAQLRYKIRQFDTLYSKNDERYKNLNKQQLDLVDQYVMNLKAGIDQFPQMDKSKKEMERQILKLRAQLEVLQVRGPVGSMNVSKVGSNQNTGEKVSAETLKKFQEQVKSLIDPLVHDMRKISENHIIRAPYSPSEDFQANKQQYDPQANNGHSFKNPIPLPISHNDWTHIKEGYSYTYSSKIPVNLKELEGTIGFDTIKAKYMIAALQLQNIQSLKLLKERETNQNMLIKQLNDLKLKYTKCLKVQDDLFIRYFKEKQQVVERIKQTEIEKNNILNEKEQVDAKYAILSDAHNTLQKKTDVEKKCYQFSARLGISESEIIKLNRKYRILVEEQQLLRDSYTNLESKSSEMEFALKEKLAYAKRNEKELTVLMNQILEDAKLSVSGDVHKTLLAKMQAINDKSVTLGFKEVELRLRINKLEGIERETQLKDEIIESLREDSLEVNLELQIVRNRLESVDQDYRSYRMTFDSLVKFINSNNISLVSYFKKFDRDGGGELDKNEFGTALKTLGFNITNNELELLFNEFDLDGSGTITYKEFLRKLRRSGVVTRSKEQQGLFKLFKAIKQAKLTIRKAFEIIDMDGSNQISKAEMDTAFRKIGIEITSNTIDYIFKICDSDNSGQISCSQFEKIFEDVVRESAIEEKQLFSEELDWKLAFVLKIEECSQKYHSSLQETFKSLDSNGNASISLNQMSEFISKAGLQVQRKHLLELFQYLDRSRDGNIQYSQFLKILEEAKKENKRVDRIKFIKNRTEELRKQMQVNGIKEGEKFKIGEEASIKVKMMALETKQNNLMKKNQKIIKYLVNKEQQILELKRSLDEQEKSTEKIQAEYFKEKQETITLQERMKHSISEKQGRELQNQNNRLKIQNLELKTQFDLYKGLFEGLTVKNKSDELRVGKIESERDKYFEIVKDLQGESDLKAELGKRVIEIQYSKRNQETVNSKYDRVIEEIRKNTSQNQKLMEDSMEKQREIIKLHMFFQEKNSNMQRNIDSLTAKILPSVNVSKIQEILLKIREISNSKIAIEIENKQLREKNFNLQIRNDYIENEKVHIEELEKKLKRTYTDQSSVAIIDLTKKMSEYKMNELKAKRQCGLLREKEEYYMRVNNSLTDNIKELEEEIGKFQIKYNEREEFWRNKLSDQFKLLEDLQKEHTKNKEEEKKAEIFFKGQEIKERQIEDKFDSLPQVKQSNLSSFIRPNRNSASSNENVIELKNKMNQLEQQLLQKEKEIYQLKTAFKEIAPEVRFSDFNGQMGASSASFVMQTDLTSSQLRNNARKFINSQKDQENHYKEEATRLTQAAQQSIDTLQRIIDDKNEQLKRKDKIIDDLRKEFIKSKEEDCREIQDLRERLHQLQMNENNHSLKEMMNKSTNKNFYPGGKDDESSHLKKIIDRKDEEIKMLQDKYDQLFINKEKKSAKDLNATTSNNNKILDRKMYDLQEEREAEKKRYLLNEEDLKVKIKNLEKLTKDKDKKLALMQKTIIDLKNLALDEVKNAYSAEDMEKTMGDLIEGLKKGKSSNQSGLEIHLQKAMQMIQELNKKNKDYEHEITRLKEDKMMKTALMKK